MSGRIRTVKPEWLEDELLASESDTVRLLSIALMLVADDHGRGRAAPAFIASEAWRYDRSPESLTKAREGLMRLSEIRFVTLYEVDGQAYFEIRNWKKHQKVQHAGKPRVPPPSAGLTKVPETLTRIPETLTPDLRSPITDHRSPIISTAESTTDDGRSDDRPDNVVALPTKKAKPAKRGTRCPASTADDVDAWLAEHKLPPLDGPWGADVARFLDYWAGVSGAKGTKLDWAATWRNYEADPRFPHPEGAAPGRKRVLGPVAAQQSPMPDLDGPPAFVREGLKAAGIKPIETPINDLGALLDLAAGRA